MKVKEEESWSLLDGQNTCPSPIGPSDFKSIEAGHVFGLSLVAFRALLSPFRKVIKCCHIQKNVPQNVIPKERQLLYF